MDRFIPDSRKRGNSSSLSADSDVDHEGRDYRSPTYARSNYRGSENDAPFFLSWPSSMAINDSAEERAQYFFYLQKEMRPDPTGIHPKTHQACSLLELMTIKAFHSNMIRLFGVGSAVGFRIREGKLTQIPAILVFVSKKVHRRWLGRTHCIPGILQGPGGIWCDVDVIETSNFCSIEPSPKKQFNSSIGNHLRGEDAFIGPGSQVATLDNCGTLGVIVRSLIGKKEVGFLTNRHVAVDLEYPNQNMFHPMPPCHGPSVYIGDVERATSYTSDDIWYGVFTSTNPETFVRADGAFIPFADEFDMSCVKTSANGVGEMGDVESIDLQAPISDVIGKKVKKVGSSTGLTRGTIMAYALEYRDNKGVTFLSDILVVGDGSRPFDMEGDSGSVLVLESDNGEKPRPIGLVWGGTACRGRIKMTAGEQPVSWTSAVDLRRLLRLLQLSLITNNDDLQTAVAEQHGRSKPEPRPPPNKLLVDGDMLDINGPIEYSDETNGVEIEFIPIRSLTSPLQPPETSTSTCRGENDVADDAAVTLQMGCYAKRRRLDSSSSTG